MRGFLPVLCLSLSTTAAADTANTEANKKIVERVYASLQSGDVAALNEIFDPEGRTHFGLSTRKRGGPFATFIEAAPFPGALGDREVTTEFIMAEGDRVAIRSRLCGKHVSPILGVAATGRTICSAYLNVFVLKDGRITDNYVGTDRQELLQQLQLTEK